MIARLIYSLVFYCITPLILLRLLWRSVREPLYRETPGQRFGFVKKLDTGPIWVHAVSAGETIAAVPLIDRLLISGHAVLVTTMTPTGRERVQALLGDRVDHVYAPYDLPGAIDRFLNATRPKALVIIDTELWPNIIHRTHGRKIPCLLVNGRLSEKSATGYRRISALTRPMLEKLTRVCAQSDEQGQRFMEIGIGQSQLVVTGSIKFDASLPEDLAQKRTDLRELFAGRSVFLAASTHEGEEFVVLEAFHRINLDGSNLLIIAPRHPHRAGRVETICKTGQADIRLHGQDRYGTGIIFRRTSCDGR